MSGHTPGPWKICGASATFVSLPSTVKPIYCGNQANARLIAAAPELLEALEMWRKALRGKAMSDEENLAYMATLRAIAKAEGKS